MAIQEQLQTVRDTIHQQAGDRPVTLVAVTKYADLEQMRAAYQAGVRHFGENRVQDALAKIEAFPAAEFPDLHWHLIGPLQSNKVKKTVGQFALIHGVDSLSLAETLSRHNMAAGLQQHILLQVNLSGDPSRHGLLPECVTEVAQGVIALPGIALQGLMAMAPPDASLAQDELALNRYFQQVSVLKETLEKRLAIGLPELSMGMSHDFAQALQWGATIIRIGNYLFKT